MTPKTSKRLIRAAQAEQIRLEDQRTELLQRRDALRQELEVLEHGLHAVDDQLHLLERLAGHETSGNGDEDIELPIGTAADHGASFELLRGTAIREMAVRVLAERGGGPIHYREWHEQLRQAGYAVSGKDPQATLLTQVSRSPVVRRTTSAGVYELDRQAPSRLRSALAKLQAELRELASMPADPEALPSVRARRDELIGSINASERALEEAQRVLAPARVPSARSAA